LFFKESLLTFVSPTLIKNIMEAEIASPSVEKRQRSSPYPYYTIAHVVTFLAEVKKTYPARPFTRDDIQAISQKKTVHLEISSAVQYGLAENLKSGGYKMTESAKKLLNPFSEEEAEQVKVECFKNPRLYAELIDRYGGNTLPTEQQLRVIVSRELSITEEASPKAISVFLQNIELLGLVNKSGQFLVDNKPSSDFSQSEGATTKSTVSEFVPKQDTESAIISPPTDIKPMLLLNEINEGEQIIIRLSEGKKAKLTYPENINETDVKILTLQLEQIALALGVTK
jgi:hypothetical protein